MWPAMARFARSRLLLSGLILAAAVSVPGPVSGEGQDDPFSGIPNVSFAFYEVGGRDEDAIRASLNAHRPVDPNDGAAVDGRTRWQVSWKLRSDSEGCRAVEPPTFSATVTLPKLADESTVPSAVRAHWERYLASLRTHEAGHARYVYEHLGAVQSALLAKTCGEANAAGQAALKVVSAHDATYDRETKHGLTQGAVFP